VNWRQKFSNPPPTLPWHEFARQIFTVAISEALIPDNGWRDRWHVWVGQIYVSRQSPTDLISLLLFVFDKEPTVAALDARVRAYSEDGATVAGSKIFAVYESTGETVPATREWGRYRVRVFSKRHLLKDGLKLTAYALDLVRRFNTDVLAGTAATLKDTFVECHVHRKNDQTRYPLSQVLSDWLTDKSRRQLALTGEYGRGKSTAMLKFCSDWAERFLQFGTINERVPLLIELRGQNPAESDPLTFLSGWASRYGLDPKQLLNLIQAGEAILIFEGFDELRHAGRAYDRHEHFNELWRMAYPGTKVIFTGRPYFFLDEDEKNESLRANVTGGAYTQLWELAELTPDEVRRVANGFGEALGSKIMSAAEANPAFFEIVSRPSMLPVVATIWDKIEDYRNNGNDLTSAILIEHYIRAIYERKEEEIRIQLQKDLASSGTSYLLLPRAVREIFTITVIWTMAKREARNTIRREKFDELIREVYDEVRGIAQMRGVDPMISEQVRAFEERFREETRADRLERVCNEVATAGLFVSDPAGGPNNLRLPHKQYYEYIIAKAGWIILYKKRSELARLLSGGQSIGRCCEVLMSESAAVSFFLEMNGIDFSPFNNIFIKCSLLYELIDANTDRIREVIVSYFEARVGSSWSRLIDVIRFVAMIGPVILSSGAVMLGYRNEVLVQLR